MDKMRKKSIGVILNSKGEILIGQFADALERGIIKFGFPGGGIEGNETYKEGLYREIFEEFGIKKEKLVLVKDYNTFSFPFDEKHAQRLSKRKGTYYKGQTQKTFLLYFTGNDEEIDFSISNEIIKHKWISFKQVKDYIDNKYYVNFLLSNGLEKIANSFLEEL